MKFQFALLALPFLAIASPVAEPEALPLQRAELQTSSLGPRRCALTGSDVRYRKCPSTDDKKCPAIGQYGKKGTKVDFVCWTVGSSVKGNEFWDKNSQGRYVSEYYVNTDCAYGLPQC